VAGKCNGNTFYVEEIVYGQHPPPVPATSQPMPLTVVSASGPYCLDDSLHFEPLHELLDNVRTKTCDLLIFTGPFIPDTYDVFTEGE
jgi:hypothetical protein